MNSERIREYCISKENVTEGFPFGEDTLVFKVNGKIFALVNLYGEPSLNVNRDPLFARELIEGYSTVTSGDHMNIFNICSFYTIPLN